VRQAQDDILNIFMTEYPPAFTELVAHSYGRISFPRRESDFIKKPVILSEAHARVREVEGPLTILLERACREK
jgi:hypothetical protein